MVVLLMKEGLSIVTKAIGIHFVIWIVKQLWQFADSWVTMQAVSKTIFSIFQNMIVATIYSDQRFGDSNIRSSFNKLVCPTDAQQLSQCTVSRKQSGCRILVQRCGTEFGVGCHSKW